MALTPQPELVFGLVGPIGIDMEMIQANLSHCLRSVGYDPIPIRVTDLMSQVATDVAVSETTDPREYYGSRIDYANAVRARCDNDAALAALAIGEIRAIREKTNSKAGRKPEKNFTLADIPLVGTAYIIRQLKRSEEIQLLRRVYGRKFIQLSISLDPKERQRLLTNKIVSKNAGLSPKEAEARAEELVIRDLHEQAVNNGQRLEEVFHLGDVFVSAKSETLASTTIKRFVDALFGKNSVSPNRDEYASYIAASASLRSIDTARQVGAAIFSPQGEVIALGCNEVPAPGGGTYWTDHTEPHRDFDDGFDANHAHKRRIAYDFIRRLREAGVLQVEGSDDVAFTSIMSTDQIKSSLLMDITEFGRMAHAEMNALLDAARLGRSTKGATLFSTTFPCHNCAKHIVTSGIKRVVFIEPYPKSQAIDLHSDSISVSESRDDKVSFEHFIGISPRRYRDIFEKGKRRKSDGTLEEWCEGKPVPRIEDKGPYYVFNEASAVYSALEKVAIELGITLSE